MSAQFRRIFQKFYDPLSLTDDECSDDDLNSTSDSQPDDNDAGQSDTSITTSMGRTQMMSSKMSTSIRPSE